MTGICAIVILNQETTIFQMTQLVTFVCIIHFHIYLVVNNFIIVFRKRLSRGSFTQWLLVW